MSECFGETIEKKRSYDCGGASRRIDDAPDILEGGIRDDSRDGSGIAKRRQREVENRDVREVRFTLFVRVIVASRVPQSMLRRAVIL